MGEHIKETGHTLNQNKEKVIVKVDGYWPLIVRESIEIHERKPELNRDQGYYLPPIYKRLLTTHLAGSSGGDRSGRP